jgi:hypothetical protein
MHAEHHFIAPRWSFHGTANQTCRTQKAQRRVVVVGTHVGASLYGAHCRYGHQVARRSEYHSPGNFAKVIVMLRDFGVGIVGIEISLLQIIA